MVSLRIIHIDNHQLFRDSLRNLLQKHYPSVDLRQFINPDSAIENIIKDLGQRNRIDLIVTDFKQLGKNAIEFAQQLAVLKNEYEVDIPVVLLTMRQENEEIHSAIASGLIEAYVSKSASTEHLIYVFEKLHHQKRIQ